MRTARTERGARRRGGTFVIVVLVASLVLLGVGGAFVDATRSLAQQSGFRDRQERALEALAGAAAWARAEVSTWDAGKTKGSATLRFSKAVVSVDLERKEDGAVLATAFATARPDGSAQARILVEKRDGKWVVSRYEVVPTARKAAR